MNEEVKRYARRSPEQWQKIIHSQQQSGLSARAFCEQREVGYASFCNWRKRLSGANGSQQAECRPTLDAGFIDLSALPGSQQLGWQITLKLGEGMELSLSKG